MPGSGPGGGLRLTTHIQAIGVVPATGDAYRDAIGPARAKGFDHAERVTISELARLGASRAPAEVADVRWYRAVGYAQILKQRAEPSPAPAGRGSLSPGLSRGARAAEAYRRLMDGADGALRRA